jgi:lipopolysaccharide/colanic/teichoic acid biosynthesis glycosyltransferase
MPSWGHLDSPDMDRGLTLKRALDLVVAVPALLLSLPLQAVAAIAVRLTMGRPVLFRQRRPGLHGEVFELVKFRTMHHEDAALGRTDDASRLTTTGRLLRKLSLDELPSLWNVVRGDMSLVGPRPLLERYLERYTPEQARRHEVRPGLTGLAQVSGRNRLLWEDKLRIDVDYVDTHSLAGDLRILLATVRQVARGTGVSADGEATMPEFHGTTPSEDRP